MQLPLNSSLFLRLQRSRLAAIALVVIHCLAIAAIMVSQLAWAIKALVLLVVVFSMAQSMRRHAWRSGSSAVVALRLGKDAEIELTYADGRRISTRLDSSSTVLHWLIVLRLRQEGGTLFLFLLPDMLDAESWRRLSVRLRAAKFPTS